MMLKDIITLSHLVIMGINSFFSSPNFFSAQMTVLEREIGKTALVEDGIYLAVHVLNLLECLVFRSNYPV